MHVCRTCTEAASQARSALRRFREAQKLEAGGAPGQRQQDAQQPPPQQQQQQQQNDDGFIRSGWSGQPAPTRLTVRLPLPSTSRDDDALANFDEGDWPGGVLQRFRRLRPLVEDGLLSGYDPEFVGMLESPADGMGVWRAAGGAMTVVAQVGNLNFAPFARLCAGEFGGSVLEPGHTLVAVNPTWTRSKDIGQLWDTKLKAAAAALIDDPSAWLPIYHLWDVRTAQGATGMLYRSWPHDWQLYSTCGADEPAAALDAPPLLISPEKPSREGQTQLLNAALKEQAPRPWWKPRG